MTRKIVSLLGLAVVGAALGAALGPAQTARAFPALSYWHLAASGETNTTPKNRCGAGGLYGTGGPRDLGVQCSHCHTDAPGNIDLQVDVSPPFTQSGNDQLYVPGQLYDFTLTMTGGDLIKAGNTNSVNGFSMSFEDPGGQALGTITTDSTSNSSANCPSGPPSTTPSGTTYVYGDCHGVLFVGTFNLTQWHFQWRAPSAGAGQITAWWGLVDGDTGGDSSLDDDVKQGSLVLLEGS